MIIKSYYISIESKVELSNIAAGFELAIRESQFPD